LEVRAGNQRALRLEPDLSGNGAPNLIGGSPVNFVSNNVAGATIAGGGGTNYLGYEFPAAPYPNVVGANYGAIGGGADNLAAGFAATIAGGVANSTLGSDPYYGPGFGTVGGGAYNLASGFASVVAGGGAYDYYGPSGNTASGGYSTVGGGERNNAMDYNSTVAGGASNTANGPGATVGGGFSNQATNNYATVPGG